MILHLLHINNSLILEICQHKQKIIKHCNYYCKYTNIKLAFAPFKVRVLFSVKESEPNCLRSFVVYRFTCTGCNTSCETTCHLKQGPSSPHKLTQNLIFLNTSILVETVNNAVIRNVLRSQTLQLLFIDQS